MNIQHAILGLLSCTSMTGYDIKKVMGKSPLLHWSGNNSQIYRVMSELLKEGFVTSEVFHEDASPTKKRYTITEMGRQELADMSRAFPELPEMRNAFLVQLTFGSDLSQQEIETALTQYEGEIRGVLLTMDDAELPFSKASFTAEVQRLAVERIRLFYENELDWISKVRLNALPKARTKELLIKKEVNTMKYSAVTKNEQTYVKVTGGQIIAEQDGIALVSACAEHGTNLLMLPSACLSGNFLRLSTRVAGLVLQKLGNYNIKTVVIFDAKDTSQRFKEFLSESNAGQSFRAYNNFDEAENWLLGENK